MANDWFERLLRLVRSFNPSGQDISDDELIDPGTHIPRAERAALQHQEDQAKARQQDRQ